MSDIEAASRFFINREFQRASELVRGLNSPDLRGWMLYLALCERAVVENGTWSLQPELREAFLSSSVWGEFGNSWNGAHLVPPALVSSAVLLAVKHSADPRPIVTFMEEFIAQHREPPMDVVDAFVELVLTQMSKDYVYAREIVGSALYNDHQPRREQLLHKINELEKLERELERQLEEKRLLLEEQKQLEQLEQLEQNEVTEKSNLQLLNDQLEPETKPKPRDPKVYKPIKLTELWKTWFKNAIRGRGMYGVLLAVFTLIAIAKHSQARHNLKLGASWLVSAAKSGIEMALKVTYL